MLEMLLLAASFAVAKSLKTKLPTSASDTALASCTLQGTRVHDGHS